MNVNEKTRNVAGHAPSSRWWAVAAVAWLLVVVGIAAHQWQFWQQDRLELDVTALLPLDEQQPGVGQATRKLADAVGRQVS
jgi:hypothetical protein